MKSKKGHSNEKGVVYFSHVPHGFFEKQMREFLGQFGTVTNLRLGRSKKTGESKGYAFVEFRFKEVAKIVAETMNNYLMFEKLLKCQVVPPERVQKGIFKGKINPQKPPSAIKRFAAKKLVNAEKTDKQNETRMNRQRSSLNKIQKKLSEFGLKLEFSGTNDNEVKRKLPKSATTTPVMEIDESDEDISLKTPPNVKKVKSRPNSAAGTPKGSRNNTPLSTKVTVAKMERLLMEKAMKKGTPKQSPKSETPKQSAKKNTPKGTPKGTPKQPSKNETPKQSAKKATPKAVMQKDTPKQSAKKDSPKSAKKGTPKSAKKARK